jgi:outer membrane protein assembly factor BamE (lipoprotein component of BamABCDE complex)
MRITFYEDISLYPSGAYYINYAMRYRSMSTQLLITYLTIGVMIFSMCAGCGAFPLNNYHSTSRGNITEESLSFITPGETRREDVLLTYGEPDDVSFDGSCVVYQYAKAKVGCCWFIPLPFGGGGPGSGEIYKQYGLIIRFDDRGVVVSRELKGKWDPGLSGTPDRRGKWGWPTPITCSD